MSMEEIKKFVKKHKKAIAISGGLIISTVTGIIIGKRYFSPKVKIDLGSIRLIEEPEEVFKSTNGDIIIRKWLGYQTACLSDTGPMSIHDFINVMTEIEGFLGSDKKIDNDGTVIMFLSKD